MRPPTPAEAQLAGWLHRLVQLLLAEGGDCARMFGRVVGGRCAVLVIDSACLSLEATAGEPLVVRIEPAAPDATPNLRTSGDALRDVMNGRALLDAVVADDRLHVRAALPDLLAFHELVLHVLSLGTRHPGLQALWAEFDLGWAGERPRCVPLNEQRAAFGALCDAVPEAVRLARSPLVERRHRP